MNVNPMSPLERVLSRAIGDPDLAEAIVGDLAEERPRWRRLHLLALIARFALRRRPRRAPPLAPRSRPMSTLLQDVRYAGRVLRRQPGFSAIVIVTLAVGIGANAAILGMIDRLLFRPLAVGEVEGVVQIFEANAAQGDDREEVSPANFLDWRRRASSFESLVATAWWDAALSDRAQEPEQVIGRRVSPGFFEALRVTPAVGRTFAAEEGTEGRHRVVVLSDRLWRRRWAASPSLVGSTITIDRETYTVVGIAPAGFEYPTAVEIYAPLAFTGEETTQRSRRWLEVIGRLAPGVTREGAAAEMQAIAATLAREHRDANGGYGVNVLPLSWAMLDLGLPALLAVWQVAVALVLLIAGANVANLLLVRGAARGRELALRLALGASRWRVVRQLVVESLVLAGVGVVLAVPIAAWGLRAIRGFIPPEIARWIMGWNGLGLDLRLLGATMAVGVVAGVLFGMLPALRASRPDLTEALKDGARGSGGGRQRMLQGFVVAQIALALALLVSAGLSTRAAVRLLTEPEGYDPANVMTFSFTLPERAYADEAARLRFYERTLERVRSLSSVEHAAISNTVPFAGNNASRPIEVEGRPAATASERPSANFRSVTPSYFDVVRTAVVRGRRFTDADAAAAPRVAIVDRTMAERLWPGLDPVGRRFRWTHVPDGPWLTVVGVAVDVTHNWFAGPRPTFYVPAAQTALDYGTLSVRTRGEPTAVTPAVRQMLQGIDPDLPLTDVHSLERWRWLRTIGVQFVAVLMSAFAGLGLFLSSIGVYGVMAYSVTQRTREIGVRMALGATAREVMGMTLRDAAVIAGAGIALGLAAAFALGTLLAANLSGALRLDAATFAVFAAVLAAVVLVAGGVPARRAMRVDPVRALRAE